MSIEKEREIKSLPYKIGPYRLYSSKPNSLRARDWSADWVTSMEAEELQKSPEYLYKLDTLNGEGPN